MTTCARDEWLDRLIAQQDALEGWALTDDVQQEYARQIAHYNPEWPQFDDGKLRRIIDYYHGEHMTVEVLRDREQPGHSAEWEALEVLTRKVIASKTAITFLGDVTLHREDLTQDALTDIWRGLHSYRYQSQFRTWAFTVITNSLVRHVRTTMAQKRHGALHAKSLDSSPAIADTVSDEDTPTPEQLVSGRMLAELVKEILAHHSDKRLAPIFWAWAIDEQTLRAISERVGLSPARVYALIQQTIKILLEELSTQAWVEQTMPAPFAQHETRRKQKRSVALTA